MVEFTTPSTGRGWFADLIGVPYRIIVSQKTVAASAVEIKDRTGKLVEMVPVADVLARIEKLTSG